MIEPIARILDRCGSENSVLPPTELFNEGWMLRLVLDWLDRNRGIVHPLSFAPEARWYSEALLPSLFLPQSRGDIKAESFTHADGVIGHFSIASGERGDVKLLPGVKQFVVIEAKLGSTLSAGTKNVPSYDQAARTVACIEHLLAKAEVSPTSVDRLGFFVLAPVSQIKSGVFTDLVTKQSIEKKVKDRIGAYEEVHSAWFDESFLPILTHMEIGILDWETVLVDLPKTGEVELMHEFYAQCLRFNPLRVKKSI